MLRFMHAKNVHSDTLIPIPPGNYGNRYAAVDPAVETARKRDSFIAVLQHLKKMKSPPRTIVLTSFMKEEEIYRAIRAGAQGHLLKDTSEIEMVAAILAVAEGKRYIPRDFAARLADRMLRQDLTPRELRVLELLAVGSTNKQIASELDISDNTVRTHVNNIMEKLQVSDRTEAVANALKKGVIADSD